MPSIDEYLKYYAANLKKAIGLFLGYLGHIAALLCYCYIFQTVGEMQAWAGVELYANCVKNIVSQRSGSAVVSLNSLGETCAPKCFDDCKEKFSIEYDVEKKIYQDELNKGMITQCQTKCQQGGADNSYFKANRLMAYIYEKTINIINDKGSAENKEIKVMGYKYETDSSMIGMNGKCKAESKVPAVYKVVDASKQNSNFIFNQKSANNHLVIKVDRSSKIYLRGYKKLHITPISPNVSSFLNETAQYGNAELLDRIPYFKKRIDREEVSKIYATYSDPTRYKTSSKNSVWNSLGDVQKNYHPCFVRMNQSDFLNFSNKQLDECWESSGKCNFKNEKEPIFDCYPKWHLRSDEFINTGIQLRDGDEVTIRWTGNMILGGGQNFGDRQAKPYHYLDHKFLKMASLRGYDAMINTKIESKIPGLSNDINQLMADLTTIETENLDSIVGEGRRGRTLEAYDQSSQKNDKEGNSNFIACDQKRLKVDLNESWYGLRKTVRDQGMEIDKDSTGKNDEYLKCSSINDPGLAEYEYSGIIEGIGSSTELKLRHYKSRLVQEYINSYSADNSGLGRYIGGMQVELEWGGSPLVAGEGLQYAMTPVSNISDEAELSKLQWNDLNFLPGQTMITISDEDIKKVISRGGVANPNDQINNLYDIYLRIKPELIEEKIGRDAVLNNQIGFYKLDLFYSNKDSSNFFADIIKNTRKLLFGSSEKGQFPGGVVKTIYEAVAKKLQVVIRVMITLFIVINALKYLIGLEEVGGNKVLGVVFKLSIVMLVVSTKSWEFFTNIFLIAIVDGSMYLASIMTPTFSLGGSTEAPVNVTDYTDIFNFLYFPFNFLIGEGAFIRIFALLTSGMLGFATAIFLIWGIILFAITIAKILVIYTFSLFGIALLSVTAPLFIPLILFKFTKEVFDGWLKYFIAYMLYPMFSMTILSVLSYMIFILSQTMLNFIVCKACVIDIPVIGNMVNLFRGNIFDSCLIYGWTPIFNVHSPSLQGMSDFFIPDGLLMNLVAFWIILHIAKNATTLSSKLVNRMVVFVEGRRDGQLSSIADNLQNYAESRAHLLQKQAALLMYKQGMWKKLKLYKSKAIQKVEQKAKGIFRRRD